jgi:alpha-beta hydrolase superfamily lysophospholipase
MMVRGLVVLLMCLAACSCGGPPVVAARPPADVAKSGDVRHAWEIVTGAGGIRIFRQSWQPPEHARAAVVIHHGLKSHSQHYEQLARHLVGLGFAVFALDMRGHGRSGGQRATLDDFDELVADLDALVEHARKSVGGRPVFVAGHSVGGAVVTLYAVERQPAISGLILLAPALRVDRSPLELAATPLTGTLGPNLPLLDVPDEHFSRDPAVVAEMGRDPLIYHPPGPARTAAGLAEALTRIWTGVDQLEVPLLGLHGTGDLATDPRGTAELVHRAHVDDKKLLLYRGLYHDLVREPERAQVIDDIARWLDERAPESGS